MIICEARNFGYVHIAKCAGSTIRHQLREFDDLDGRFFQTVAIDGVGRVNGNHLPLTTLARFFPDDLERLRQVTSYAIVRDPADRFVSGIAQRFRSQLGREPSDAEREDIEEVVADVITTMEADPDTLDRGHVYFTRQASYIEMDGERIIDRIVPFERIDVLFDQLEADHGFSLNRESIWNPTVTYRYPAVTSGIKQLKDVAKRVLPVSSYMRVRDIAVPLLTRKGAPKFAEVVLRTSGVDRFVSSFYRRDAELHASALSHVGAT